MRVLLVGIGAAGNKAVNDAIKGGVVNVDDTVLINSTSKDFPADYTGKTITLSPRDEGCGKERSVAKDFTITAIKAGKLGEINVSPYTTVVIVSSVEGGTGSGSTSIIAKYFKQVYHKNVLVIGFIGFEDDIRGIGNTIEFFQDIDKNIIVQTIRNKAFLKQANGNKFKAEQLANEEMCKRIQVLSGKDFIASGQNIDDTDILKVANTVGYMTVEKAFLTQPLMDNDEFERIIKKMIYESKSIKSKNPGAQRIGVILNIDSGSEDAIDYSFGSLQEEFGYPYERFLQKQWDGKKEYIAFIISGMQLPVDEMVAVYDRYQEGTAKVNKNADEFFDILAQMNILQEDKKFDMIKKVDNSVVDVNDFLSQFETK